MKKLLPLILICFVTSIHAQNCIPNTSSISFDGTSSYVSIPSSPALNISDSITIEAWINSNMWGFTSAQNSIVCKHGWYFGEEGYVLRAGGTGELSFNIAGTDGIVQWHEVISSTGTLQLNTWYHVAGTFDGSNLKVYINGVLAGTTAFIGTIVPSTDYDMNIGRLADMNQPETRYWSGMIDEVRIWHRALDAPEILANMNKHIDPLTANALVGYWRLNDVSGTSVLDLSSGGNNGTCNTTTWSSIVPFTEGPPVPTITLSAPNLLSSSITGNQWNLNGVPILNETGTFYQPTQDGNYTVTVTDISGCSATSVPYIINAVNNIDANAGSPIKILNDQDRILHFVASPEILSKAEMKLLDINGRVVSIKEKGNIGNEMNVKTFSAGIYMMYVEIDRAEYKTKIILN